MNALAIGVALWVGSAWAGPGKALPGPAASAAEIPALAELLDKAGWEPTPELSGVFKTGAVFRADGATHSLMIRSCFDAEQAEDTYTSAEVVSQLQAGVRVKLGMGSVQGSGELMKKVKFGAPVHATLERLSMEPDADCLAKLEKVPSDQIDRMYAVQEVLTAEIAEQTCGRIDASGKFVGLGSAEGELSAACLQESLEPVAVAYRTVPLRDLLPDSATRLVRVPETPSDCPWPQIKSVSSSMTVLAINGEVMNVRGVENRTKIIDDLHRCGYGEAAVKFDSWRRARRVTNGACATLVGCYPFGIGIAAGLYAGKYRKQMERELLSASSER